MTDLRNSIPGVVKDFNSLGRSVLADGALDRKTKALIAMALGLAARCDPCLGHHAQALVKLGASRQAA